MWQTRPPFTISSKKKIAPRHPNRKKQPLSKTTCPNLPRKKLQTDSKVIVLKGDSRA